MKKNLLKLLVAFAAVSIAVGVYAGDSPKVYSDTITLTNTVTSGTDTFDIFEAGVVNREIVKIELDHQSGLGTGTVTVALINLGGSAETVDTSTALTPGGSYSKYPVLTTTVTDTDYVVTGNVAVAVSPIRTIDIGRYTGRKVRVSVSQPSNATTNTYKYVIHTQ